MKVVLDTNVWISGMFWEGGTPFIILYEYFAPGKFEAIFSEKTYGELTRKAEEIRKRYKFSPTKIERYLRLIKKYAEFVEVGEIPSVCRDPRDNLILVSAFLGKVDFIVSGDKDLLALKVYKQIKIVSPKKFLEILESGVTNSP